MEAVRVKEYEEEVKPEIRLVETPAEKKKVRYGYLIVKRIFDVVMSCLALVVLSPVFLITAVAIYIEDREPVLYSQKRIGQKEIEFKIYKFRSMKKNADKGHELMKSEYQEKEVSFKLKDDPRVTKVGKVIRKFNIDELPQLINIIKGDMSIVGPRPLPTYEYQEEREIYGLTFAERYKVPQGLTCFWQVSNRADISFEDRMRLDVDYAKSCNVLIDVKLIIHTGLAVISGKAGY